MPQFGLPADASGSSAGGWSPEHAKAPTGPAAPSAFDSLMAEFTQRAETAGFSQAPDVAVAPFAPAPAVPAAPAPAGFDEGYPVMSSAFSEGHDATPSYALPSYAQPPEYQAPSYEPVATWHEPVSAEAQAQVAAVEPSGFELLGLVPTVTPVLSPPPAAAPGTGPAAYDHAAYEQSLAEAQDAAEAAASVEATEVLNAIASGPPEGDPVFAAHVPIAVSTPEEAGAPTLVLPTFAPQRPELQAPSLTKQKERGSRAVGLEPDVHDTSTLTDAERDALDNADQDLIAALQQVVLQRASDLHITINAAPTLRVDGGLRPAFEDIPWSRKKVTSALMSLLSPAQADKFEEALELDFAFTISANARFRVNFYQQRGAIGAAFRLIPTEIKKLAELGVPDVVSMFATLPRGLVLVTGPTGSGKSTTLAALIDLVNETRADHIVTVEDPIEFMHTHKKSLVNQREVGADTHSFTAALKHVLRQDPDVILVGELRDLETISVALTAAETGHLVFATLHTQSAPQTVDRIIDVFPPHQQEQVRAQLALTLQGVVCQTLVKRVSGKGRAVATEILVTTPAVSNLIREGQTHQITAAMQAGGQFGMRTLDQHLAELVNSGVISRAAAKDKSHDIESLEQLITRSDNGRPTNALSSGINYRDAYTENLA